MFDQIFLMVNIFANYVFVTQRNPGEKIDNGSTQLLERLNNIKSKTNTKIQAKLCKESNTTLHTEIWHKPWTTSWIGGGSNKPTYCKWNKPNYKTIYRNPEINLLNKCTGNETKRTTELHQQSGDKYHKQTQKATQTTQTPHRQSRDESRKRMYCKSNKTNQRATSTIENWLYSATTCKMVKTLANHVPWRVACGMCVRGRFDAQLVLPLPAFHLHLFRLHKPCLKIRGFWLHNACRESGKRSVKQSLSSVERPTTLAKHALNNSSETDCKRRRRTRSWWRH